MVQIEPPPGWKPPAGEAVRKPAASAPSAGDADVEPPVYTAELIGDEIARPSAATPQELRTRRMIYAIGGVAAAAIVVAAVWSTLGGDDEDEQAVAVAASTPSSTPAPQPTRTPGVTIKPAAVQTAPVGTSTVATTAPTATGAAPTRSPILALAEATSTALPSASASPTSPPTSTARASGTPAPVATALAATAVAPPRSSATAASPPAPNPPAASLVDTSQRLDREAGGLRFSQTPRRAALEIVASLAGLAIDFDWDSSTPAELGLSDKIVAAAADGATLRTVLAELLAPRKLQWQAAGPALVILGPAANGQPTTVEYAVADLTSGDAAQSSGLAELLPLLIAPPSWISAGGVGTIQSSADKLVVVQTPLVQREIAALLDRLRAARGKRPVDPQSLTKSRIESAATALEAPITMNFRPAVPLRSVTTRLEELSGVMLTFDAAALAEQGTTADTLVGVAAEKHPLAVVLTALCEPRGWAWRIVDPTTIEITTRDALRRRGYVELYDVRPLLVEGGRPESLLAKLKQQTAEAGWIATGGSGVIVFDAGSGHVVVRQHQQGHQRLAALIAEAIAAQASPVAAGPSSTAPRPTPSPTGSSSASPTAVGGQPPRTAQ